MPKIELSDVPVRQGSGYPAVFAGPCAERTRRRLGDAAGLQDFGVNLMTLPPGGWSSQRHWHSHEDEFVIVLDGELTLVEDATETLLRAVTAPASRRTPATDTTCRTGRRRRPCTSRSGRANPTISPPARTST